MRWTSEEKKRLRDYAERRIPIEAISLRLRRSEASVLSKARREGLTLNTAVALPRLNNVGRLEALGGLEIPGDLPWPPPKTKLP